MTMTTTMTIRSFAIVHFIQWHVRQDCWYQQRHSKTETAVKFVFWYRPREWMNASVFRRLRSMRVDGSVKNWFVFCAALFFSSSQRYRSYTTFRWISYCISQSPNWSKEGRKEGIKMNVLSWYAVLMAALFINYLSRSLWRSCCLLSLWGCNQVIFVLVSLVLLFRKMNSRAEIIGRDLPPFMKWDFKPWPETRGKGATRSGSELHSGAWLPFPWAALLSLTVMW